MYLENLHNSILSIFRFYSYFSLDIDGRRAYNDNITFVHKSGAT